MSGVTLPEEIIPDLQSTIDSWRLNQGKFPIRAANQRPVNNPFIYGFLRQDLYNEGTALVETIIWMPQSNCWVIEIDGDRPTPEASRFAIELYENGVLLDTRESIDINSTSSELKDIIIDMTSKLKKDSVTVFGGNPFLSDKLIHSPSESHEDVQFVRGDYWRADQNQWHVLFSDSRWKIVARETETSVMLGGSEVSSRKTFSVPSGSFAYVTDRWGMLSPTPALAGTLIMATLFPGVGYCLTSIEPSTSSGSAQCPASNEVQWLSIFGAPSGGDLVLSWADVAGDAIEITVPFDATSGTVQTEIEEASSEGICIVTGGPLPSRTMRFEWTGDAGSSAIALAVVDYSGLTGASAGGIGGLMYREQAGRAGE